MKAPFSPLSFEDLLFFVYLRAMKDANDFFFNYFILTGAVNGVAGRREITF